MIQCVVEQYRRLLEVLCYKAVRELSTHDLLAVTYFQLLQVPRSRLVVCTLAAVVVHVDCLCGTCPSYPRQDRVSDALSTFARVSGASAFDGVVGAAGTPALRSLSGAGAGAGAGSSTVVSSQWSDLQLQYLRAYLDFYSSSGPTIAKDIADTYASHPVPRWARRFQVCLQAVGV